MSSVSFDQGQALDRLGGDTDLLLQIAEIFCQTAPPKLAEIRQALAAGDAGTLTRAAHSLKGSVANFSAGRAWEAARNLEMAGRGGQLDLAKELAVQLEHEVECLLGDLKALQAGGQACAS